MNELEYQKRKDKEQLFELCALMLIILGMIAYDRFSTHEPKEAKPLSGHAREIFVQHPM